MNPLRDPPAVLAAVHVTALPADPSCAGIARSAVRETLTGLGVGRDSVGDAMLMVSELATNAFQHAAGDLPHELWTSVAGDEAFCAVFDARPPDEFCEETTFSGDHGRGLAIISELSHGRWGVEPAESRLSPGVLGKAVWFACPRA